MLHIYLRDFQITHRVKQGTTTSILPATAFTTLMKISWFSQLQSSDERSKIIDAFANYWFYFRMNSLTFFRLGRPTSQVKFDAEAYYSSFDLRVNF